MMGRTGITMIMLAMLVGPAMAGFYDGMDYTASSTLPTPWYGNQAMDSASTQDSTADGLTLTGYVTEGVAADYTDNVTSWQSLGSSFNTKPGTGVTNTIYMGYLIENYADGSTNWGTGSYGVRIGMSDSYNWSSGLFMGVKPGTSEANMRFRVGGGTGTDTGSDSATAPTMGETYFLLAKFEVDGGNWTDAGTHLWAYMNIYEDGDVLPTEEPTTWDVSYAGSKGSDLGGGIDERALTTVEIGNLWSSGSNPAWCAEIDEVRVSQTFSEVIPSTIPEPMSMALLALGGAVISRRRRR